MGGRISSEGVGSKTTASEAGPIEVRLFGRFEIASPDGLPRELCCAKSRELFAYLLLHRDRAHRREAVADRLWGENMWSDPRKTFRQALWQLQTVLSEVSSGIGSPIESSGSDWIRVDPTVPLDLDVAEFEVAWTEVEKRSAAEITSSGTPVLKRALDLYRGDLLEGNDWDWCLFERERLKNMFLTMSDAVTSWCARSEDYALGIRIASRVLSDDPAREKTHRRLMQLYALAGDPTSALRQYESCAEILRTELDVAPSLRTREIVQRIREDRYVTFDTAPHLPNDGSATASQLPILLKGLVDLRGLLVKLGREVDREIESLQRALGTRR